MFASQAAPPHPQEALLIGAAGFIGLNLVDALRSRGIAPRCGHRRRTNTIPLKRRKTRRVLCDLDDPRSLSDATAGVKLVFHLAGHYPRHSQAPEASVARATSELQRVLDACAHSGVERVVYVSSTATVVKRPDGLPSTEADTFASAPTFGAYHKVKWAMEEIASREDRMEVLIACPSACLGPWDLRVGTSALVVGAARGQLPPLPDGRVSLVDVRDVAQALAAYGLHPSPPRRLLLSGPAIQLSDLLAKIAKAYGASPPPASVDAETAFAFANAEERRVAGTASRAALAREIVDLIVRGATIDASLAEETLQIPWRPLSDTLSAYHRWAVRLGLVPELAQSRSDDAGRPFIIDRPDGGFKEPLYAAS